MTFDCMTPEEYALWAEQTARNRIGAPCYDCPIEFHLIERAAGRCDRDRTPIPPKRLAQMREAQRRYRSRLASRARAWDNDDAGTSSEPNRLSPDAVPSASPRWSGVVAFRGRD